MTFQLDTSGAVAEWRAVIGYEGFYEVSALGEVRSVPRTTMRGGRPLRLQGLLLQQRTTPEGYKYVNLHRDGKDAATAVHRIVALAFIPNDDDKPNVNHLDNDRANNAVGNLRWCTQAENVQHAAAQGRMDWERVRKPQLDPFTSGYIEAIRRSHPEIGDAPFAPETLARIMEDCAAYDRLTAGHPPHSRDTLTAEMGRAFWEGRQRSKPVVVRAAPESGLKLRLEHFAPLTVAINDAGKVVFA